MPLAAVGFDLDDTLCVPDRDRAHLLEAAAVDVEGKRPAWASREAYRAAHRAHLTGESRVPVFETMLDGTVTEVDAAELARAYRERVNASLRPVPGVDAMLRQLSERYRVGLLTNGPRRAQRSKLETLGWTDAFDAICVSGELPAGKPDPRAFEALLDALEVRPEALVFVGDDVEADVGGAVAVGCLAIQVVHEDGPEPDPRADAHVPLASLATTLPSVIDDLATA